MSIVITNVQTGTETVVIDDSSLEPAVLSIIQKILLTSDELITEYDESNGAEIINYGDKIVHFRDQDFVKSGDILTLESAKVHSILVNSKLGLQINIELEKLRASINSIQVNPDSFEAFLNHSLHADAQLDELYDTVDEEYYKQMGWVK